MRVALCTILFAVACKGETKPSEPAPAGTRAADPATTQPRPRPSLPDSPDEPAAMSGDRPRLPGDGIEPRDWSDPAVREEMRAMREERRRQREAMLDTNKDGVVSPEEHQARLKPMVERLDSNGDGKLTVDELTTPDRRMGFDDPGAVDADHNGEISLAELDAAVTARREKMRARWRGQGGGSANLPPEPD